MHCPRCAAALPEASKFCLECGERLIERPRGEVRIVTALFADMSGSVAATFGSDPESATDRVQPILQAMVDAVTSRGGVVDRFLGDGLFALFGSTEAHEDDAERAIEAGLAICEAVALLDAGATVGINTGPAYLGAVGGGLHAEHTAMGTTINLAARIQAQTSPGEVLVGAPTRAAARGAFDFAARTISVKGVGDLTVYAASPSARGRRDRGFEGRTAAIIGRDAELASLERSVSEVSAGRGGVVCLVGEPGLGKSRLVAELVARAGTLGVRVLEGRCSESSTGAFAPIVDALREWADEHALTLAVDAMVEGGSVDARDADDLTDALALLLGLRAARESDPTTHRNRMHAAAERAITATAATGPLALVMEDLHWSDPLSLDVLRSLFASTAVLPLLVVCVFRPEVDHGCARLPEVAAHHAPGRTTEVRLRELSASATATMVESLVGLTEGAAGRLGLDRAEGNPLFVEELVGAAVDAGVLVADGDGWRIASEEAHAPISATLHGIVQGRVDRLPADLRAVLHAASVIGRAFPVPLLQALLPPDLDVAAALDRLEVRGFVFQDRVIPEVEYSFKHVLVRETVYESILRRDREPLHLAVADAIEGLYADRLDDHADRLARHLDRTTAHGRAFRALVAAGVRAQHQALGEAALEWYDRAVARADRAGVGGPELVTLWERRADVLALAARADEVRASLKEALALAGDDHVTATRLHRKTAAAWVVQREYDAAVGEFATAASVLDRAPLEAPGRVEERFDLAIEQMYFHYWRNEPDRIAALVAEVGDAITSSGDRRHRAGLLQAQLMQAYRMSRYVIDDDMLDMARRFAALADDETDHSRRGYQLFSLGFTLVWRRELGEAVDVLSRALRVAGRAGDAVTESRVLTYLTVSERCRGSVDEAAAWADLAFAAAVRTGMAEYEGAALGNQAWAALRRGDERGAEALALSSLEVLDSLQLLYGFQWIPRFPLVVLAQRAGDLAVALEHLRFLDSEHQQRLTPPFDVAVQEMVAAPSLGRLDDLVRDAERLGYA